MSTRSHIGVENPDGTIDWVYCHYDGYPTGVGAELFEGLPTKEAARDWLAEGDRATFQESFVERKGELLVPPRTAAGRKDFESNRGWADYLYLMTRDEVWWVANGHNVWRDLKEVLGRPKDHEGW